MNSLITFIDENKEKYLNFISGFKGFPYVCDSSSDILGAYLAENFEDSVALISGDYEDRPHWWIEVNDEYFIDFTSCQFFNEYDSRDVNIMKLKKVNLFEEFIIKNDISLIVTPDDELFEYYSFLEYASFSDELINIARLSESFDDYLKKTKPYLLKCLLIDEERKKKIAG